MWLHKTTLPAIPQIIFHTQAAVFQGESLTFCSEGAVVASRALYGHTYSNKGLFLPANIVPLIQHSPHSLCLLTESCSCQKCGGGLFLCFICFHMRRYSSETFMVQSMLLNRYHLYKVISIKVAYKFSFILNIVFKGPEDPLVFFKTPGGKRKINKIAVR